MFDSECLIIGELEGANRPARRFIPRTRDALPRLWDVLTRGWLILDVEFLIIYSRKLR